jgi:hypothetical protein
MLNYYNPILSEWIYSDSFWGVMISAHTLMLLVPGFVAMVVEHPHLFRRNRSKVVPLAPRERPLEHPFKAA